MDSVTRLGSTASVLVGACYLATAVAYLAQPPAMLGAGTPEEFWTLMAQGAPAHLFLHGSMALAGVLGLAVVPAVARRLRSQNEGWALWASALAYLAFAVTARSHLMELEFDLRVAPQYLELPSQTRAAVPLIAGLALDSYGFLTLGGLGLWTLLVGVLGLRGGLFPKALCLVGVAFAIATGLAVVGFTLQIPSLMKFAVALAGVGLAPIWFVGLGLALRRP